MRESPPKRSDTTSARKWSPVPVKSSTEAVDPGRAPSMRSFKCSAVGIAIKTIATPGIARIRSQMVTLTDIAAKKVSEFLATQEQPEAGLRVAVKGGGCSGFQYQLALDERHDGDQVFDYDGIRILVDEQSLRYVDGSTVDYTESLMGAGFQVNNPTGVGACGCAPSSRVADKEPSCG